MIRDKQVYEQGGGCRRARGWRGDFMAAGSGKTERDTQLFVFKDAIR